jgi:hypothetical protein
MVREVFLSRKNHSIRSASHPRSLLQRRKRPGIRIPIGQINVAVEGKNFTLSSLARLNGSTSAILLEES